MSTYYLHKIVGSFLTVIKWGKKSSKCSKTYEADGSLINLIMNHILLFNSNTTAVFLKLPLSPLRHVALTSVSVKYVPTISSGWLTVLWWMSVQRAIGANSNTLHKQHLQHSLGVSTYDNGWEKTHFVHTRRLEINKFSFPFQPLAFSH